MEAQEYVKSVHELKNNVSSRDNSRPGKKFRDGTDQRNFYDALRVRYKKLDLTKPLTEEDRKIKEGYERIRKELDKYEVSFDEKVEEYINSITLLERNVKHKQSNNGESERTFRDGTDQRSFYDSLKAKYKKLDSTKPLTMSEQDIKEGFEKIQTVLNDYEVSFDEKVEEYINSVHELKSNVGHYSEGGSRKR